MPVLRKLKKAEIFNKMWSNPSEIQHHNIRKKWDNFRSQHTNLHRRTDGPKTENHVGAYLVTEQNSRDIYTDDRRLENDCAVFQAELLDIQLAVDWI